MVWADDKGVSCRRWNWRESERTKLTASATDAILVVEARPPKGERGLLSACEELASLVEGDLGGTSGVEVLAEPGSRRVGLDCD